MVFESSLELYLVSEVHTPPLSSTHGTSKTCKYEVLTPPGNMFSRLRILSPILVGEQAFGHSQHYITKALDQNQKIPASENMFLEGVRTSYLEVW